MDALQMQFELLTKWREPKGDTPALTEVFLAALGVHGTSGFQCELGFGDNTTEAFQAETLEGAIHLAYRHAVNLYGD